MHLEARFEDSILSFHFKRQRDTNPNLQSFTEDNIVLYLAVQEESKQKLSCAAVTNKNLYSLANCCISIPTIWRKTNRTRLLPIFNTRKLKKTKQQQLRTVCARDLIYKFIFFRITKSINLFYAVIKDYLFLSGRTHL